MVAERLHGEGGELRRGCKLFPGGTKIYYESAYWGTGADSVTVLGLGRRPRRWITATLRSSLIENWRAQLVYAPRVLDDLHDDEIHGDEHEARALADVMNKISVSTSRRLVPRTAQENRDAADDAAAMVLPGPATVSDEDDQAFILYAGTQAIAGLVCHPAPRIEGARPTVPLPWRDLWLRPPSREDVADADEPGDHFLQAARAFADAVQARLPWHDLATLHAELDAWIQRQARPNQRPRARSPHHRPFMS